MISPFLYGTFAGTGLKCRRQLQRQRATDFKCRRHPQRQQKQQNRHHKAVLLFKFFYSISALYSFTASSKISYDFNN